MQRSRSRLQRSERCATPAVVAAAVLQCLCSSRVRHSSAILSASETTQGGSQPSPARGSARLGRREESSAGARRRRRALAWPLQMARGRPTWQPPPVPKWTPPCLRRWEDSPPPRRRRGVASADGGCQWLVALASVQSQPSAHDTLGARRHSSPTPRRRVAEVWSRTAGKRREGVPLERQNPHPQNTRTLRPWQICAPRQNPHVLPPGFGSTHPKGGSIGFGYWVIRGGCAKEMKRAELALGKERRHRVVCFHCYKSPEQEAKSQQIVGQSLLSCLQYPVPYLSRLQRIYPSQHSKLRWSMMLGRSLS